MNVINSWRIFAEQLFTVEYDLVISLKHEPKLMMPLSVFEKDVSFQGSEWEE